MTTQNKRKLAALNKENCEKHPRSNLAQNSIAPRSRGDYITQVSEKIEGKITKRLSKEFSRTENRILGALASLDDFLMNPLLHGRSGTTPEPSQNALSISQGANENDSQNEAGLFHGQLTQNTDLGDDHDSNFSTSTLRQNCNSDAKRPSVDAKCRCFRKKNLTCYSRTGSGFLVFGSATQHLREASKFRRSSEESSRRIVEQIESNCRSISAKPKSIQKEKDIPRLPDN